jgi:hypothetical protein
MGCNLCHPGGHQAIGSRTDAFYRQSSLM